mmetsp:Transcript_47635/g.119945  ORF Transcript_47635/g.119945 Transcript_47635/m.119945 type:complete len:303 (+) Transcript_47635:226-1134(+)
MLRHHRGLVVITPAAAVVPVGGRGSVRRDLGSRIGLVVGVVTAAMAIAEQSEMVLEDVSVVVHGAQEGVEIPLLLGEAVFEAEDAVSCAHDVGGHSAHVQHLAQIVDDASYVGAFTDAGTQTKVGWIEIEQLHLGDDRRTRLKLDRLPAASALVAGCTVHLDSREAGRSLHDRTVEGLKGLPQLFQSDAGRISSVHHRAVQIVRVSGDAELTAEFVLFLGSRKQCEKFCSLAHTDWQYTGGKRIERAPVTNLETAQRTARGGFFTVMMFGQNKLEFAYHLVASHALWLGHPQNTLEFCQPPR